MNFIDILTGKKKATSKEIGGQIVELEGRITDYENQKSEARTEAKRLRQRRLGGDKNIKDADLREVDRTVEEIQLDLEAGTEALQALKGKLTEAVKAETEKRLTEIEEMEEAFKAESRTIMNKIVELSAQAKVLQMQLYSGSLSADGLTISFVSREDGKAFYEAVKTELEKTGPQTLFTRQQNIKKEAHRLRNLKTDEEAALIVEAIKAEKTKAEEKVS
ncbi:MAG: hypothetical protein WCV56_03685 [Candidatus Omnitrophota bacterium]